jgi:hypothetical protein
MRHLRRTVLAALALALCLPSMAGAHSASNAGGQLVSPQAVVDGITGGEAMGLSWARGYSLPSAENPARCLRLGRTRSILVAVDFEPVPCTVRRGTTLLVWGITNTCSTVEEPPFLAVGSTAQRRCARTLLEPIIDSVVLTVDRGRRPIDLKRPQFEIFSPQQHVLVPADNPFGVPAQRATFTAWGWVAWLKDLPAGQHTIRTVTTGTDESEPPHVISLVVNVV